MTEKGRVNQTKVVQLEIENEELTNEARRRGYMIQDLELKFDTQLEEIELLQNELEEQIERLKQQLSELTADLNVKDKELRKIRYKQLLESPMPRQQAADQYDKAGHVIHSARANGLNRRSQSKASDEHATLHLDPL